MKIHYDHIEMGILCKIQQSFEATFRLANLNTFILQHGSQYGSVVRVIIDDKDMLHSFHIPCGLFMRYIDPQVEIKVTTYILRTFHLELTTGQSQQFIGNSQTKPRTPILSGNASILLCKCLKNFIQLIG